MNDAGATKKTRKREKSRRTAKPIRYTRLHDDGSIANAQRTIETKLKLPKGSVKLVYKNGRRARSDSNVGALKRNWGTKKH